MNLDFIYYSGAGSIVATAILAFFGILIILGIMGFVITVRRERAYARTALPSLESEVEETPSDEEDTETVTASVFDVDIEEVPVLEDNDANKLMADIDRAKKDEEKVASNQASRSRSLEKFANVFKKNKD